MAVVHRKPNESQSEYAARCCAATAAERAAKRDAAKKRRQQRIDLVDNANHQRALARETATQTRRVQAATDRQEQADALIAHGGLARLVGGILARL